MTCDDPTHADLQTQTEDLERQVLSLTQERDELRDSTAEEVGIQVGLAEYQRRTAAVQSAQSRIDQGLVLLAAGLAILASGAASVFAALWAIDRTSFYAVAGLLSAVGWLFVCAILSRDIQFRLVQTEAEQVQSRLRNLFVSRAPHLSRYLSDTIYDDWPTPYSRPRASATVQVWGLMIIGASILLSGTVVLFALVVVELRPWAVGAILGLVGVLSASIMTAIMLRGFRRRTARYTPRFPGYGSGQ